MRTAIERNALDFRRPLYSQWLVQTDASPLDWTNALLPLVDANDRLLVCRIESPAQGWLDQADWNWLNARI